MVDSIDVRDLARAKTARRMGRKAERKMRARRRGPPGVIAGLGLFGLVGWSIAVPTLAGIALGWWLDEQWPSTVSWTITLLFIGVVIGCLNAWRWVRRESRDIGELADPKRR